MSYRTPTLASLRKMAAEPGSKIAVLPTAAPRRVQQLWDMESQKHRHLYREANPWPGETAGSRFRDRMDEKAREAATIQRSPELLIALALYKALGPRQREKAFYTVSQTFARFLDDDSRAAMNALLGLSR